MQKLNQEKIIRKERFSGQFITALVFIVAILAIGRVILANRLIESSADLRDLDEKISLLSSQNENLAEQLREKEGLSLVASQAEKAGFTQTAKLTFIQKSPSVAQLLR